MPFNEFSTDYMRILYRTIPSPILGEIKIKTKRKKAGWDNDYLFKVLKK
jgi:hypothetical protein